jgi:hypothetical protein
MSCFWCEPVVGDNGSCIVCCSIEECAEARQARATFDAAVIEVLHWRGWGNHPPLKEALEKLHDAYTALTGKELEMYT